MCEDVKSIAIFGQDWSKVIRVINKKHDVIELIATMKVGKKPPRRLFVRRRKQTDVKDFVRVRIDRAVQPELFAVQADHLLVDCELIRRDRRNRL